jgi:hypothetical protein
MGNPYGSDYLLTGLLFCEACNYGFRGRTQNVNKGKYKYHYYEDNGYFAKGIKCGRVGIRREELHEFALDRVKKRLSSKFWLKKLEKRLYDKFNSMQKESFTIDNIGKEIKSVESEINNLLDVIAVSGLIPQLETKLKERQSKLDKLKRIQRNNKVLGDDKELIKQQVRKYLDVLSNTDIVFNEANIEEKKRLLRLFLNKAVVSKERDQVTFYFYKIPEFYTLYPPRRSILC